VTTKSRSAGESTDIAMVVSSGGGLYDESEIKQECDLPFLRGDREKVNTGDTRRDLLMAHFPSPSYIYLICLLNDHRQGLAGRREGDKHQASRKIQMRAAHQRSQPRKAPEREGVEVV
jgi:hypothetical protein